jgi:hypothetical protein
VDRRRNDLEPELPEGDDYPGILEGMGAIHQLTDEYTSPEIEKEYLERLKRKRPLGFSPWPAEPKRDPGKRR